MDDFRNKQCHIAEFFRNAMHKTAKTDWSPIDCQINYLYLQHCKNKADITY